MSLVQEIRRGRKRLSYTQDELAACQEKRFRELLLHAWDNSPFYRDYYSGRGVHEADLSDVQLTDLPAVSKELLMEHFDDVVTDPALHKKSIEEWIQLVKDPRQFYERKYVVMHTSGTSGNIGVFVYGKPAANELKAAIFNWAHPVLRPLQRTRIAYYAATHGRFAGVALAANMPRRVYNVRLFSVLDPTETVMRQIERFQPHQLVGYASTIADLAEKTRDRMISLSPKNIIVSGDPLTEMTRHRIEQTWPHARLVEIYAASESIGIAIRRQDEEEMTVLDDLQKIELLDDKNNEVGTGETGRIVLTNFYNRVMPLIRYEMHDLAVRGSSPTKDSPYSKIRSIQGRLDNPLPITLDDGKKDEIHPIVLSEFFVPGLEKVQFASMKPDEVYVRYVADRDLDEEVKAEFYRLLHHKGAVRSMKAVVQRVDGMKNDEKTGKFHVVT
ncbi:MAG: AMP-binding protein [Candidatus Kerfeldbacteria bacterium]